MKLTRIFRDKTFQVAWLILSILLGVAGTLSGVQLALQGHFSAGIAGIVGGPIVVLIGCIGLWGRMRTHLRSM
jgi:hypothetical protein